MVPSFFDNPLHQDALAAANPFNAETHKGYHTSSEVATKPRGSRIYTNCLEGTSTRFWRKA